MTFTSVFTHEDTSSMPSFSLDRETLILNIHHSG